MNLKLKLPLIIAFALLFRIGLFAGEGMWIPLLLQSLNEKEMQSMGMKMSAEDIYSVNKGSLKDAIVHFGGFCTAEVISDQGLLLTNHHCGYGQIQAHSTIDNNLLKNGFWAKSLDEELPNNGLFVTFIVRMDDVTETVLTGVGEGLEGKERQGIIDQNISTLQKNAKLGEFERISVRPFYNGNQYFSFTTVTYNDVRLVGTPPESIGKFGADTDNWIWPRHTGDFSMFRIYADANNNPANYSEDNVPYKPKHSLPISLDGVEEGDFTMVLGFPGRTNEYLPATSVKNTVEVSNPAKIAMRDAALTVYKKHMLVDESLKLQYAPKFARIANAWKKWQGESLGIKTTNGLGKKKEYEAAFEKKVKRKRKLRKKYGGLLKDVSQSYVNISDASLSRDLFGEMMRRNVEIFRMCKQLEMMANSSELHGEEEYLELRGKLQGYFTEFYSNYKAHIDEEVLAGQINAYIKYLPSKYDSPYFTALVKEHGSQDVANYLFSNSMIANPDSLNKIATENPVTFASALHRDPLFNFFKEMSNHYYDVVDPDFQKYNNEIKELQRVYMKAQMEVFPKKRFYPDANGTLRVSYGYAEGYETKEAGRYKHITYLDGVIDKYVPGDYEFDVDKTLRDLHASKNYGQYTDKTGKVPVCFIGSNHTSGGNSGSPAIDAHGNLIGLNFDRVWEGTMSDINYDRSICRNIMVDARYVLFIVDKYAGAQNLIAEMKLVHPKK